MSIAVTEDHRVLAQTVSGFPGVADRRRVLGADHPSTLASASNLAADRRMLGEADDDS